MATNQRNLKTTTGEHAAPNIFLMHLLPGMIITLVFVIIARLTALQGWPASLALLVTWVVAGIPLLLGILFYQGYKLNGVFSLEGVLLYRQAIPFRHYLWLVPALIVSSVVGSMLFYKVGDLLRQTLFGWWPSWLNLEAFSQNPFQYPSRIIWTILVLSAFLNIAVPVVEELYFRSFLLPRIPLGHTWASLLNTVLFSLYHFWLPWDFFGRVIALLPVVYFVQWKRNVYLSIIVHCLLNSIGTLGLLFIIMDQIG